MEMERAEFGLTGVARILNKDDVLLLVLALL
jgi:hypothetical protein